MARGNVEQWAGGYVRKGIHYIHRRVGGVRYELSTHATTEAGALAQLQRFEADPAAYEASPVRDKLVLDDTLVGEFLKFSRYEKGNTAEWVKKQKLALAWWAERLGDRDLRRVSLVDHVLPHKAKATGWAAKVRVLKAFFGWLRKDKHVINLSEDPVAGTLRVAASNPEQWAIPKVILEADYKAVRDELPAGIYRDALIVIAGTGWHRTEVERFASGGQVLTMPGGRKREGAAVLLTPRTKAGNPLRNVVSREVAAAGKRLREHGYLPLQYWQRTVDAAASRVTAERRKRNPKAPAVKISLGSFRHTVATRAIEAGATPEAVSAFLNHQSKATTLRFYATLATPPRVPALA